MRKNLVFKYSCHISKGHPKEVSVKFGYWSISNLNLQSQKNKEGPELMLYSKCTHHHPPTQHPTFQYQYKGQETIACPLNP